MDAIKYRINEVQRGHERGWSFTPLVGKNPTMTGWQRAPRETLEQATAWAEAGNVGIRTGEASGVAVVDLDAADAGDNLDLPTTATVTTSAASGKRHLYYRVHGPVPNSVKSLGADVDLRGDRGQAVFVGSVHPDTGDMYRWAEGLSPDDVEIADFPWRILPETKANLYRAVMLRGQGLPQRKIAENLGISQATVSRLLNESNVNHGGDSVNQTCDSVNNRGDSVNQGGDSSDSRESCCRDSYLARAQALKMKRIGFADTIVQLSGFRGIQRVQRFTG